MSKYEVYNHKGVNYYRLKGSRSQWSDSFGRQFDFSTGKPKLIRYNSSEPYEVRKKRYLDAINEYQSLLRTADIKKKLQEMIKYGIQGVKNDGNWGSWQQRKYDWMLRDRKMKDAASKQKYDLSSIKYRQNGDYVDARGNIIGNSARNGNTGGLSGDVFKALSAQGYSNTELNAYSKNMRNGRIYQDNYHGWRDFDNNSGWGRTASWDEARQNRGTDDNSFLGNDGNWYNANGSRMNQNELQKKMQSLQEQQNQQQVQEYNSLLPHSNVIASEHQDEYNQQWQNDHLNEINDYNNKYGSQDVGDFSNLYFDLNNPQNNSFYNLLMQYRNGGIIRMI